MAARSHQLLLNGLLNRIGIGAKVLICLDGLHGLDEVGLECIVVFFDDALGFKGTVVVW